jgi:hypothetical protein
MNTNKVGSNVHQLIDIFWSDITNKEVITRTYEVLFRQQGIPDTLKRFFDSMKDFLTPGSEKSAFFIIEPYGESLERLEPKYFAKQRSIFYKENDCIKQ